MLTILINILVTVLALYLGYSVVVQLVLSLAARQALEPQPKTAVRKSFLVLIPAYREDKVIEHTVRCALDQKYAADQYTVLVIADSLQASTLERLRNHPIEVVEYAASDRTKTKAIQKALSGIAPGAYDVAVVVDADNQLAPNFLSEMNRAFAAGSRAVQGMRKAANLDTQVSVLDAIAEAVNHQIYAKGAFQLGISPRLMGSGMAFELELFRTLINTCTAVGGFDKELEIELSRQQISVVYQESAVVYDEKVRSGEVFEKQRQRWISAQFFYLGKYWKLAFRGLIKGGSLEFLFKVSMLSFAPRLILPALLSLFTLLAILLTSWSFFSLIFGGLLLLHLFSLGLAVPRKFYSKKYLSVWWQVLPLLLQIIRVLGKLKGSNQSFIHTPHGE